MRRFALVLWRFIKDFFSSKKKISSSFEMPEMPIWVHLAVVGVLLFTVLLVVIAALVLGRSSSRYVEIPPSEFEAKITAGIIDPSSVFLKIGNRVSQISGLEGEQNRKVRAEVANDAEVYKRLVAQSEKFGEGVGERKGLPTFVPLLIIGALGLVFLFLLKGGGTNIIPGLRRHGRIREREIPKTRFTDVGGVDEARAEVEDVVDFLRNPQKFYALGARIPRGILLTGPSGTGKTLLARAVAGEAGVSFFSISASEFVEIYAGKGAAHVRDVFRQARRQAPSVVFVDEIDAVGRHRGSGVGMAHDEREQTLNQILVEMSGFETADDATKVVIVLAATNRPDILDSALLRPGRFDRKVALNPPDFLGRKAILKIHAQGKPLRRAVSLGRLAEETPGFVGADLENFLNEAAILAAKRSKSKIGPSELGDAFDKILAGPERKTRIISSGEKQILAYHEAGHALVAWALPYGDRVRKISIVARDTALGFTTVLPERERYVYPKEYFNDILSRCFGGRVSEQLFCGDITASACDDLAKATALALKMVTEYGMSEALGMRTFGHKNEFTFLGREMFEQRTYSEETARKIDEEVDCLLRNAQSRAREVLKENEQRVHDLVKALIAKETLQGEELFAFLPKNKDDVPRAA